MTGTASKLLLHRNKITIHLAFLCLSISSFSAHAATTEITLNAKPVFESNEGGRTVTFETRNGIVMLDLTHPLGVGTKILSQAKSGSCLSIKTPEPLFVRNRADTDHVLISVTHCKSTRPSHKAPVQDAPGYG